MTAKTLRGRMRKLSYGKGSRTLQGQLRKGMGLTKKKR
jgi:hypothetical protein